MENNTLQFKTNINCSGCVAAVKPHLDSTEGIGEWNVDTGNKEKILTVKSNGITTDQVVGIVKNAGYKIEPLNS